MRRPCISCNRIIPKGTRCASCENARLAQYQNPQWQAVRKQALARDGGCVVCGATEHLHGHHLDKVSKGHSVARTVILCRECHPKVERGRISLA